MQTKDKIPKVTVKRSIQSLGKRKSTRRIVSGNKRLVIKSK